MKQLFNKTYESIIRKKQFYITLKLITNLMKYIFESFTLK